MIRAQHRARAEELMERYERGTNDPQEVLMAAIAHGVLALGDDTVDLTPGLRLNPAGHQSPRH